MWVPFAVLLGLFSLLVGGLAGLRIAENQDQAKITTPAAVETPAPARGATIDNPAGVPDYNTQR